MQYIIKYYLIVMKMLHYKMNISIWAVNRELK